MLRRLHALYLRYVAVHGDRARGVTLGPRGKRIGRVETVMRSGDQIRITGWADADHVRLTWDAGEVRVTPDVHRADVAAERGLRPDTGFEILAPAQARLLALEVARSGETLRVDIGHPSNPLNPAAHRRLKLAFLRDVTRALPALMRHSRHPTQHSKDAVKRALGLDVATRGHRIDPDWFSPPPPVPVPEAEITIVLPIYNALPFLKRCLARVASGTNLPWHLIAVDDASTDPDLGPWLAAWAAARPDRVTLITHTQNVGFVGAVNAGLSVAERRDGGPVILLNTDAMVPDGWASRLIAPLASKDVASVTPLSNAAEVLSVPAIGPGIALAEGESDLLDGVAQSLGAAPLPDVPTGVGFCMAMSRTWLSRVPRLDPAFGRGYGEEVDWSEKVRALGARHVCQPRLFVEHVGGQSFGNAEKALRQRAANNLIAKRYPDFDAGVQRFIAEDPLATPRLALAVALAGHRVERLPVFLAHSLGGGAEVALQAEISALDAAVVLRVGGPRRWQVEVHVGGQFCAGQTDDLAAVQRLLAAVPARAFTYSCGVGDPEPIGLPAAMLSLKRAKDTLALRIHDYFALSPSYTLLGRNGFVGVPTPHDTDAAHTSRRRDGRTVSLAEWRAEWGKLVDQAQELTVFSPASAALVQEAYPTAQVKLRPHSLPPHVRPVMQPQGDVVGLLGNMNHQKGARVLQKIATAHPEVSFVVVGLADSIISLPRNVTVHGAYAPNEITDLTLRYGISRWLMPAIWPETFSFATREALATGLPVAGFALGAQGEALSAAANGITVPLLPADTAPGRLFAALTAHDVYGQAAE